MEEINDGVILIVDDDPIFLKVTSKILGKAFKIETAVSGFDALKLIDDGFEPQVILSDQRMPGMDGAEFLKRSMEKAPQAVRVIITASPDPRDIIRAINEGHAYMFLTKPFENLELFQSVKLAMDHYKEKQLYNTVIKDKSELKIDESIKPPSEMLEKISSLEKQVEELKNAPPKKSNFSQETIIAISDIIRNTEKFYFTEHTYSVLMIAKTLGQIMQLNKIEMQNLVIASLMHNVTTVGMPERLLTVDPNTLEEDAKIEYFDYFEKIIKILRKIEPMNEASKIIAQMWEHSDGSGSPVGLEADQISKESQILQMANIFHNFMYGINNEKAEKLKNYGIVFQTRAENNAKHKELIKYLFRNARWFDYDVFISFQDMIKDKELQHLQPIRNDLELNLKDYFGIIDTEVPVTEADNVDIDELLTIEEEPENEFIEKEINSIDAKVGMKTVYAIRSKNGITVIPAEKELNSSMVNTINEMAKAGQIPNKITVLVLN